MSLSNTRNSSESTLEKDLFQREFIVIKDENEDIGVCYFMAGAHIRDLIFNEKEIRIFNLSKAYNSLEDLLDDLDF
jgi:hypothetical protein